MNCLGKYYVPLFLVKINMLSLRLVVATWLTNESSLLNLFPIETSVTHFVMITLCSHVVVATT